jgi:nucleoside-diphosphate-sugar epimerase
LNPPELGNNEGFVQVAVAGGTGVLGRIVLAKILARGHHVHAVVVGANLAPHERLSIYRGDILEPATLEPALASCQAVLHLATAIPRRGMPQDWNRNTAVRTAGTRNLLAAAGAMKVGKYIQQSVSLIYAPAGDRWVDESFPTAPASAIVSPVLEMEASVCSSPLDWIIMRGGVFYGPGTDRMFEWNERALTGTLALPGAGKDFLSLIHVEDMADAVVAATETPLRNAVLNVVDDQPVSYKDLFEFVAQGHGAPAPVSGGPPIFPSLRISNARAKERLMWRPCYKSYRDGWLFGAAPQSANL